MRRKILIFRVLRFNVFYFSKGPEVCWFLLEHSEVVGQLGQPLFVVWKTNHFFLCLKFGVKNEQYYLPSIFLLQFFSSSLFFFSFTVIIIFRILFNSHVDDWEEKLIVVNKLRILSSEFWIQSSGFRIQNSEFSILNS